MAIKEKLNQLNFSSQQRNGEFFKTKICFRYTLEITAMQQLDCKKLYMILVYHL